MQYGEVFWRALAFICTSMNVIGGKSHSRKLEGAAKLKESRVFTMEMKTRSWLLNVDRSLSLLAEETYKR